jgi:hypothetical protein
MDKVVANPWNKEFNQIPTNELQNSENKLTKRLLYLNNIPHHFRMKWDLNRNFTEIHSTILIHITYAPCII